MQLPSLTKSSVEGKKVLLRLDLNLAFLKGKVIDDYDVRVSLATLEYLKKKKAVIIVLAHRGRPHGKALPAFSLRPVAKKVASRIKMPLVFFTDPPGEGLEQKIEEKKDPKKIFFLENLRFWKGEEENDKAFAKELARLGDLYINEAFGNSHRRHASMATLPTLLPHFSGFQLMKEVEMLGKVRAHPIRPYVVVLGGAKILTKLDLIQYALKEADAVLVGGALANAFLKMKGIAIGKSFVDGGVPRGAVEKIQVTNPKLHLPLDVVVAKSLKGKRAFRGVGRISNQEKIYDIGPDTIKLFTEIIQHAHTVVWNGPLGIFEEKPFQEGTYGVARAIASKRLFSVVGGGETTAAVRRAGLVRKFSFLSSGGGAMVDFLVGKPMPGIDALRKKNP